MTTCAICTKPIDRAATGRPRRYCSDECRIAARRRPRAVPDAAPGPLASAIAEALAEIPPGDDRRRRILSIELLVAAQALDLRLAALAADGAAPEPGIGVRDAHRLVRQRVAHLDADREPAPDLAAALAIVKAGSLSGLVAD